MGILDAPGVSPAKARAQSLFSKLAPASTIPIPAVTATADTPTVSWGTAPTVTGEVYGAQTGALTEVGSRGTWTGSLGRLAVQGISGLDFYVTGGTVEVAVFPSSSTGTQPIWIWVNGAPVTATPDVSQSLTAGTVYYLKLVFPDATRRRVELFAPSIGAWYSATVPFSGLITPAPRRPTVAFVFDSFGAGSSGSPALQCAPFLISRMLGVECYNVSYGGTGYVNAGAFNVFGSNARVSTVSLANPELIVLSGSLNDDVGSGIQAAASAAYAAYAAALPNARLVVFGPQPSNATDTTSANRAANIAAVAAAAAAAPNVIGFHDMVGSVAGTVPAAWVSNQTYNDGTLVTDKGSVYKLNNNGATYAGTARPSSASRWQPMTFAYSGTGKSGSPVGDGTRDTFLYSDGVHPLPDGSAALAIMQANLIRADLRARALA
jgi:hypothetical protein